VEKLKAKQKLLEKIMKAINSGLSLDDVKKLLQNKVEIERLKLEGKQ